MKGTVPEFLAFVIAGLAASFTQQSSVKMSDSVYTDYYFQFVGIRGAEEGNLTKWVPIIPHNLVVYQALYCPGITYGCKLVATDTVIIGGVTHPREVYTLSGSTTPTTGTYVSSFRNVD